MGEGDRRFEEFYEEADSAPKGFGGFGIVYRFRSKSTGEIVAVKTVIPPPSRDDPEKLLKREINILRDLSHPGIVALKDGHLYHEVDKHGRDVYKVVLGWMDEELYEYLHDPEHRAGRPLTSAALKKLRPHKLPIPEVKNIIIQVALAIQYMHSKNIIHRDIKLENIMRSLADSRVKLIDFGMARVLEGMGDVTSRIGSRRYMAPEVTNLKTRYTLKADVWSLGVVVFLLLARRYPFEDDPHSQWPITNKIMVRGCDCFDDEDGQLALDLIRNMLNEDQMERFSIGDVLDHPWLLASRTASILSEHSDAPGRSEELLLHIHRAGFDPLRIYLSTMNLSELRDPDATVLVSSHRSNVDIPYGPEGSGPFESTWTYVDEKVNRGGRMGSFGRILSALHIGDGTTLRTIVHSKYLCNLDHQEATRRLHGKESDCFRSLWLVQLDSPQTQDFVWSVYSSLREHCADLATQPNTSIYMSLIGYEKRSPNGELYDETKLKKICQSVVQEVAGFAFDCSWKIPAENLSKITLVVWEDLFTNIKEGFRRSGVSSTMSVLNDLKYLGSLTSVIRKLFCSPSKEHLRTNPILRAYIENLYILPPDAVTTSVALQICYWGGRIGRFFRNQNLAGGMNGYMMPSSPPRPLGDGRRERATFVVDLEHAFEVLERNMYKAEEKWMPLLGPFDAAATLHCVKYLLEEA